MKKTSVFNFFYLAEVWTLKASLFVCVCVYVKSALRDSCGSSSM